MSLLISLGTGITNHLSRCPCRNLSMKSKHTLLLERVYRRLLDVKEQTGAAVHRDSPNLTSVGYHQACQELLSRYTFSRPGADKTISFQETETLHALLARKLPDSEYTLSLVEALALDQVAYLLNCDGPIQLTVLVEGQLENTALTYPEELPFEAVLRHLQVLPSIGVEAASLVKPGVVLAEPPDLAFGDQSSCANSDYARALTGRVRLHLFLSGDDAHANIEKVYAHLGVTFKHARLKPRRVRLLNAKTIHIEQQ